MTDSETEEIASALPPLTERKAKAQHQHQPMGQPLIQVTFMIREYTPTKLNDIAAKFQPKPRASIQAWLAQLWDMGEGRVMACLDWAGDRENEQHCYTDSLLAVPAWDSGIQGTSLQIGLF